MSSDDTVAMIPTFFNPGAIPISENTRAAWTKNKCPANRSIPGFFLFHAPLSSFNFKTLLSRRWCASATSSFERAMFLTEADGDTARGDNAFLLFVSRTRRREGRHLVSPFERIRRLTKIGPNFRQFRIIHGPWRHLSLSLPLCGLTSGEEDGGGGHG